MSYELMIDSNYTDPEYNAKSDKLWLLKYDLYKERIIYRFQHEINPVVQPTNKPLENLNRDSNCSKEAKKEKDRQREFCILCLCVSHQAAGTCVSLRRVAVDQCRTALSEHPVCILSGTKQTAESPEASAYSSTNQWEQGRKQYNKTIKLYKG